MRIPLFSKPPPIAIDPVCAMKVNMENPNGGIYTLDDITYYFCGPGCNRAFQKEPEEYLSGRKKVDM